MGTTIEQLAGVAHAMHALLVKRADQLAGDIANEYHDASASKATSPRPAHKRTDILRITP